MSKTLTGAYPSGYTYDYSGSGSASLTMTATASIGGTGLVATNLASVSNLGQIIATAYGAVGATLTNDADVSNSAIIAGAVGHKGSGASTRGSAAPA